MLPEQLCCLLIFIPLDHPHSFLPPRCFFSLELSAPRVYLSLTPHAGVPLPGSWQRAIRHLSIWNEVRVTLSIKNPLSGSIVVNFVYFRCVWGDYSCAAWPSYLWSQCSWVDFLISTMIWVFLHTEHFLSSFTAITKKRNIIHLHTTFAIVQLCNQKKYWQWLLFTHQNEISVTFQNGSRNSTRTGGILQKRTMHSCIVNRPVCCFHQ